MNGGCAGIAAHVQPAVNDRALSLLVDQFVVTGQLTLLVVVASVFSASPDERAHVGLPRLHDVDPFKAGHGVQPMSESCLGVTKIATC